MSEQNQLVPVEQKQVLFYDDEITAVQVDAMGEQTIYVPVRPICDFLGVAWNAQYERIQRDPVLSEVVQGVRVTRTPQEGGAQEMTCLPLDYLSGWLFGINANRVKEQVRGRLIRYQRECYKVLAEAFSEGRLTASEDFSEFLNRADDELVQAYQLAQAVVKLARNQIMLEARLTGRIDEHEERLEAIETQLRPSDHAVSEDQASQISQAVKAVAIALGKKTKRNEFGAIYGELYRKFSITSYKMLPASRFQEAMDFLTEMHEGLVGDTPF